MTPCAHCGNELPDGATFCNKCWQTVSADGPAAPASASGFTMPGPPPDAPTFSPPAAPTYAAPPAPVPYEAPAFPGTPPASASPWDTPAAPPPDPSSQWGAPPPPGGGWGAPPPPPGVAYGASGYAAPYGGYYGPPVAKTNGLAIASLVCSLAAMVACGISAPVGVVLGHIALSQIKRDGSNGRGMAIAGLVIGYIFILLLIGFIVLAVVSDSSTA